MQKDLGNIIPEFKNFDAAIDEAFLGAEEGGIPIGSILTLNGDIVSKGHNRRIQNNSVILHAEMDCLEKAGRIDFSKCTLITTLSPCDMCSGAILLYKIPTVIILDNINFKGSEDYLMSRGVDVTAFNNFRCVALMKEFIQNNPKLWNEDIGIYE